MPFFRSFDQSAPGHNPDLPWPLEGIVYVIMFLCVPGIAFSIGLVEGGLKGFGVGLLIGVAVAGCNCLLFDWFIDSVMVRFQAAAQRPVVRVFFNIAGLIWAIGLTILSAGTTLAVLYRLNSAGA